MKKNITILLVGLSLVVVFGIYYYSSKKDSSSKKQDTKVTTEQNTQKKKETEKQIDNYKKEKDEKREKQKIEDERIEKENREAVKKATANGNIPQEYKEALKKAQHYSHYMYRSKKWIYYQLSSTNKDELVNGDGFSKEAAQYAVDNLNVDFKEQAVKKIDGYKNFDLKQIRDFMIDVELFSEEETEYAIKHLKK
ncbi:Ltp family lipoprotein [Parvimonas micra]|uniref:Ltp family lipoprotein n=1 Tax=Parvimonas TaxID=543311 RepID=UPI00020DCEBB|nr:MULTISPECIES: Ltp family lipoprotein [unclassified Parvimonas]EGL35300.1 hypothetical protein HMPREF9126_1557 [Parvimonas sp. oral taxon 110 str. F0139]MEB3012625.1 Ltp family lipoprotein [Parvimonas sp. D2]MEB3088026.1 Ltp family lipoprotein [Parvimonas sp. D4]